MKYVVEGRKFDDRKEAITFAAGLADKQDRSVDVMIEVEVIKSETKRSWICRMHPPGEQRTLITAPRAALAAAKENRHA